MTDCTRSHPHELMSKECELRTEIARLTNRLALILPMAKGYAAAHPVGSNATYIDLAEQCLEPAPTGQSGEVEGLLREARKALRCLYIEVDAAVAEQVDKACSDAFNALAAALRAQGAGEPVAWVTIQPDRRWCLSLK